MKVSRFFRKICNGVEWFTEEENKPKNFVENCVQQKEKPNRRFVSGHYMCYVKRRKIFIMMYQGNERIRNNIANLSIHLLKLNMVKIFGKLQSR